MASGTRQQDGKQHRRRIRLAMTNKQRNEVEMAKRERKRRSERSEEDKQTLANEDM